MVLDASEAMIDMDLKPSRLVCSTRLLEHFLEQFFDQNPISQVGFIMTRNKRAEKVVELNSSPKVLLNGLKKVPSLGTGEPSLQNSLETCLSTLK